MHYHSTRSFHIFSNSLFLRIVAVVKYISGFKKLTETTCERVETPLHCVEAAIDARDVQKVRKFFFCPGDWIFFAPIPPGLSTYRALDDLAKEVGA